MAIHQSILITNNEAPCKGCEERVVGCHGSCERYSAFRKKCNEDIAKRKERNALRELNDYVVWRNFKNNRI